MLIRAATEPACPLWLLWPTRCRWEIALYDCPIQLPAVGTPKYPTAGLGREHDSPLSKFIAVKLPLEFRFPEGAIRH